MSQIKTSTGRYTISGLYWVCALGMFAAGLSFSVRIGVSGAIKAEIFDAINLASSGELIGAAIGASFTGYGLAVLIVSPFLDLVGAKRVMLLAAGCFIVGPLMLMMPLTLGGASGAGAIVTAGMAIAGIGWGCVEGSVNPLITAAFSTEKTKRLNMAHAYWPVGIFLGGVLALLLLEKLGLDWRVNLAFIIAAGVALGALTLRQEFPPTEAKQLGVGFTDMLAEPFRRPTFWIFFAIMFLTASTELAPASWVDITLTQTTQMPGIIILLYVSAVTFVMRHFAGHFAHRLSDVGLLCLTAVPAAIGLYLLSFAHSPLAALFAATIWGIGVCYMWPTMLAAVSYRYPRGGAWVIGLAGFAAAIAMQFILPVLGSIYDQAKLAKAGGEAAFAALQPGAEMTEVLNYAATVSFQTVAIIPVVLVVLFALIWAIERARGLLGGSEVAKGVE